MGEACSVLVEEEEAIAAEVFDKRLERGKKKIWTFVTFTALIPCKLRQILKLNIVMPYLNQVKVYCIYRIDYKRSYKMSINSNKHLSI